MIGCPQNLPIWSSLQLLESNYCTQFFPSQVCSFHQGISGFLENIFGLGAILANFLGCSLFKVGEHGEFWALVGLPRLDTVLTFLGGDVFFTISSLLFSDNVLLLLVDLEGFATSDLFFGLLCLFLLCSASLLPVLASCLAS